VPAGTEMVMPGDNVTITGELIAPIAMEEGLRFAIREGGKYRRRRRRRQPGWMSKSSCSNAPDSGVY
jgi:hypothetical protein